MLATAPVLLLAAVLAAIPPLTEGERIQLDSASDFDSAVDAGALYPLLNNAVQWKPGDEAGAMVPDYAAILEAPAEHRGDLFLIRGLFNGVPHHRGTLAVTGLRREGPWTGKLELWDIVVNEQQGQLVEVYLVNPPVTPPRGAPVTIVARFYKVWRTQAGPQGGEVKDFLLFVGHSAEVGQTAAGGGRGGGNEVMLLVGLVLLMVVAFYVLRGRIRRHDTAPVAAAAERVLRDRRRARIVPRDADDGESLPTDPVAALDELQRRHWDSNPDDLDQN